jgi:hypothetical protein
MYKIIYIFSIIVLFIVIFYLAKELYYYYFVFKEGIGMFGIVQNKKNIVAAAPQQATAVQDAPSGYSASIPAPSTSDSLSVPTTNMNENSRNAVNEYQDSKNYYKFDTSNNKYNSIVNNLNIEYHDDYLEEKDKYGNPSGTSYIVDNKGNTTAILPTGLGVKPIYYNPEDYVYGSTKYVPNYEDSVYLSRTSNSYNKNINEKTTSTNDSVCNYYKNYPDKLENACQRMDPNICISTSCCVLLDGKKCVRGNVNGPISNTIIPNRDFYYYQKKCYGNCERQ